MIHIVHRPGDHYGGDGAYIGPKPGDMASREISGIILDVPGRVSIMRVSHIILGINLRNDNRILTVAWFTFLYPLELCVTPGDGLFYYERPGDV